VRVNTSFAAQNNRLLKKGCNPDISSDLMLAAVRNRRWILARIIEIEWVKKMGQPGLEPGPTGYESTECLQLAINRIN